MEEYFNKFVENFVDKAMMFFEARIFPRFEKFHRDGVKLTYTEAEAAKLLNIEKSTLAEIRKSGGINYNRYTRFPTYDLADLMNFIERHKVVNAPPIFVLGREVSIYGAEVEQKLRKVG